MLNLYKKLFSKNELLTGNFGIEREALRVDDIGNLSTKKHPETLGEKIKNPYITTDFSESQIEMITPVFSSLEDTRNFLESLYDIVSNSIDDEYLWPQSMPCKIIDEDNIPIADFGDGEDGIDKLEYRKALLKKYGGKKQLISGIHYNFSFKDGFIKKLYNSEVRKENYKKFKNEFYLKITRNYLRYRWFLVYVLGGTPTIHESYAKNCIERKKNNCIDNKVVSFRNSRCGYENIIDIYPSYKSVESHVKSIVGFMTKGIIEDYRELYSQIRLKPKDTKNPLDSLLRDGVNYIEIRSVDINPFEKSGISLEDLRFIHMFLLYASIKEEEKFIEWQEEGLYNQREIAIRGRENITLRKNGRFISKEDFALSILKEMETMNKELSLGEEENIERIRGKFIDPKLTYASRITEKTCEEGFIEANMLLARKYKDNAYKNRFKMVGYEDMELSTQILLKEAIKRGITFEILDRSENFISLSVDGKKEYIRKATETSLDSYSTYLAMENKVVTKKILIDNKIKVPKGYEFYSLEESMLYIEDIINKPIVVKPKSTNFGIGISIFPDGTSREDLIKAFEIAFDNDNTILVEEFIKGKEFRFLVIGDAVPGILNRVPANVVGNGVDSIKSLVKEKNKSYLRDIGYKTPLEKIKLDKHVDLFLHQKNIDIDYIPKLDEVIYLRENSNISTGGDSIDYTDDIPQRFKDIAVKASKAIGATICGVDLMIEDFKDEESNYSIIELNFNPAIHIHSFPYKGVERKIAEKVLKALNLL